MELRFVKTLLDAGKTYFESKGVTSFDLEKFAEMLRLASSLRKVDAKTIADALGLHPSDASGYLRLGWHSGLLSYSGKAYYATRLARDVAGACSEPGSRGCVEAVRRVMLSWYPLRVFLSYLCSRRSFNAMDAVRELGGEMRYWNGVMMRLGLPVSPAGGGEAPEKPFNSYVVSALFERMVDQLYVGCEHLREPAEYWYVRGREDEPVVAVAVAHVVYTYREPVLVTPRVDDEGLGLVVRALREAGPGRSATLVTVKGQGVARYPGLDVEFTEKPLHANIYASEGEVLLSSANLTGDSLYRSVEFGVVVKSSPSLLAVVDDLLPGVLL
ncbi:phospholipase D-like domain-containing protein [Thermofilum pendens]|uniref:Uncharacterized protein n=1 Tax=Thermofilum pendens (strain DSM 2475 / Hrk 5) TaxID=368408 RepID=A1RZP6_THEPD|nr:hypothetical protein [Thermofilum pendens]ABL78676.1 hypothetical protein Tpen_1278 [Thermofilum pendens Hrk 5]